MAEDVDSDNLCRLELSKIPLIQLISNTNDIKWEFGLLNVQFMSNFIFKYWEIIRLHFLSYDVSFTTRTESIVSENEATINQYLFYFLALLCCYGTEELTTRITHDEWPVHWHHEDNEYENAQFWRAKITITFVLKFHRLLHEDKVIRYIISDLYSHVIVFLIWLRESALLTFWDISVAIYDVIMIIIWI